MKLRPGLLRWLMRHTIPVTAVALPLACLYMLLRREPMGWRDPWPAVFVLVHVLTISQCLGRFRSGEFAFTYSRGFSRDALYGHTVLASALSALIVWLPAALIVWTPVRAWVQHAVLRSPWFPIMAPREASVPLIWLLCYAVLLPMAGYTWIRLAQPTRGGTDGPALLMAAVPAAFTVFAVGFRAPWFTWVIVSAALVTAGAMLIAGRRLHRRLEVQL